MTVTALSLIRYREANDLTQTELGEILGVSRAYICRMEVGSSKISPRMRAVFEQVTRHDSSSTPSQKVFPCS